MAAAVQSLPTDVSAGVPEANPLSNLRIAARIPGADYAFQAATALYAFGKTKTNSMPLVNGLISSTERTLVNVATPLVNKHASTIEFLDNYACGQMDTLESTLSAVKTSVSAANDTWSAARTSVINQSTTLVQDSVITPIDNVIAPTVKIGANFAESAVDLLLPAAAPTEQQTEPEVAEGDETETKEQEQEATETAARLSTPALNEAVVQCRGVVTKAKMRAYKASIKQLDSVKARAADTIELMKPFTVDLISYAKTVLDDPTNAVQAFPEVFRTQAQTTVTKATAATQATAAYITEQRALLRAVLGKHSQEAVAYAMANGVQPVKAFLKNQLDSSETWESFTVVVEEYRQQAIKMRTQVGANESVGAVLENVTKGYLKFEGVADPYTMSMLSAAREWLVARASSVVVVVGASAEEAEMEIGDEGMEIGDEGMEMQTLPTPDGVRASEEDDEEFFDSGEKDVEETEREETEREETEREETERHSCTSPDSDAKDDVDDGLMLLISPKDTPRK